MYNTQAIAKDTTVPPTEYVFLLNIRFPVNRECEQKRESVVGFIAGKRSDQYNEHQRWKVAQNKGAGLSQSEEHTDHEEQNQHVSMASQQQADIFL